MGLYDELAKQAGLTVEQYKLKLVEASKEEADARKAETERIKLENAELQGKREALAKEVKAIVDDNKVWGKLKALKATGLQVLIIKAEGQPDTYDVKILYAQPKLLATTGNGGKKGELSELWEASASPDDKAKLDQAVVDAQARGATEHAINSLKWSHKNSLRNRLAKS